MTAPTRRPGDIPGKMLCVAQFDALEAILDVEFWTDAARQAERIADLHALRAPWFRQPAPRSLTLC